MDRRHAGSGLIHRLGGLPFLSLEQRFLASQSAGSVRALYIARASDYAAGVWIDRSGLGMNTAQSTGTKQPAYDATGLNGLPAISFDGGDCLQVTLDLGAYTAVAVMVLFLDTDADGSGTKIVAEHGANFSTGGLALMTNEIAGGLSYAHHTGVGSNWVRSAGTFGMASPAVVTGYGDVSLATNEVEIRHNIVNVTNTRPANSNNTANFTSRVLNIGARNNAAGNAKAMKLSFLAVIAWSDAVSGHVSQIAAGEAIVKAGWGL